MKNRFGASLFLLAALAVAILIGQVTGQQRKLRIQVENGKVDISLQKGEKIDDRTFVEKAAQDGMLEVKLGQLATQKAANPDVKKFGQKMVTDHGKANEELKKIATKFNIEVPRDLDEKHKEKLKKFSQLEGKEFDQEYMKEMVKDHMEGIKLFEQQASDGKNTELKQFASKSLPILREHLNLAKEISQKLSANGGGAE